MNLKTGVMAAKNSALPSQVYITFETLKIEEKTMKFNMYTILLFLQFFENKRLH